MKPLSGWFGFYGEEVRAQHLAVYARVKRRFTRILSEGNVARSLKYYRAVIYIYDYTCYDFTMIYRSKLGRALRESLKKNRSSLVSILAISDEENCLENKLEKSRSWNHTAMEIVFTPARREENFVSSTWLPTPFP